MSDPLTPWTVVDRRQIVRDRWLDLRAETVTTGAGASLTDFYILTPRDWSVVLAVTEARNVVMVRQYRHGGGIVSLELPGGEVDPGDPSALAAAIRELAEETGYACGPAIAVGSFSPNPQSHANRMHVAIATGARRRGRPTPDAGEELIVEEVPLDSLAGLIADGTIQHGLHIAAIALALPRLMRNDI